MIVHFEGLDLAGKSTVCRRFVAQAPGGWEHRRNRITDSNPVHDVAESLRLEGDLGEVALGELYWAALLYDLEKWVPPAGNLVQDSTLILRSYAYHTVCGNADLARRLHEQLDRHPRFDRSLVCTCDREVRLDRLRRRRAENLASEDFLVRDHPETFAEMERCLIETAQQYFSADIVDTGGLEASEDISWLIARVPGLGSGG